MEKLGTVWSMSIRVLFLGEIVGRPGIQTVKETLKTLRQEKQIDLVIANGEGATNGFGLGRAHSMQLLKLGIDVLTGGEKIYYKMDMVEFIANILGNADFPRTHLSNAFSLAQMLVDKAKEDGALALVQFHASPTAEKLSMGFMLDGKASAVIGTHTKVLSSDATILKGGTAYITDNGRCGSQMSVGGFDKQVEIDKLISQVPSRSQESWEDLKLVGVLVDIADDGKATSIETIQIPVEAKTDEKEQKNV